MDRIETDPRLDLVLERVVDVPREKEWQRHSARVRNEARRDAAAREHLKITVAVH